MRRKYDVYADIGIDVNQFAVSDMMKTLNPAAKGHKAASSDGRWLELFRRLDRLSKLQLIVCPDSAFHRDESMISPFNESLKRLYELLSGGVTFRDAAFIESDQLRQHALRWAGGKPDEPIDMSVGRVIQGDLNGWTDRLLFTWNAAFPEDEINRLRTLRSTIHTEMVSLYETWATEKLTFDEVFAEEVAGYGRGILEAYTRSSIKAMRVLAGMDTLTDLDVLLPSPASSRFQAIRAALEDVGVKSNELTPRTLEYLSSESMKSVPFLRIRALLYAAVARKAAAGKKRPPTRGLAADVEMVSLFLPYCDAMLLDNEIGGYLKERPLVSWIGFSCKVFTPRMLPQFMRCLDEIEGVATPEHLKTVEEVYGTDWPQPFETLYAGEQ